MQDVAGAGAGELEAGEAVGDVLDGNAFFTMHLEPSTVDRLRPVTRCKCETFRAQARDREVSEDAALGGQHGGEGDLAFLRDATSHDAVEPVARLGAGDAELAEVLDLIDADAGADGADLAAGGLEGVGAREARFLVSRFVPSREVVGHLEPELVAPDCAKIVKDVIHRSRPVRSGGGALFVGVADGEAFLIEFNDFRDGVARGDPLAVAGDVEAGHVALCLAFDHPLRKGQADAAALGEAGHDGAGGPEVAQARDGADEGVAVGGEGEGAVDDALDAGALEHGEAVVGHFDAVGDLVEVVGQQLVAEIPGRSAERPGLAGLLVEADAEAAALLAEVGFSGAIKDMGEFGFAFVDLGDVVGHEILVGHRQEWQIDAGHGGDLASPEAGGVDDVLGVHGALACDHIPGAVGTGLQLLDLAVRLDLGAGHLGGTSVRMGRA